ncbi:MAG: hypothetical protein OET90_04005 [Desulfuromonadales bacterium]|nr:hypothetical protein [Desulfuromonadales bacterium]
MRCLMVGCIILALFLGGCAIFTPPAEDPLLTKEFKGSKSTDRKHFALAATDANRRVAIMDILNNR